MYRSLNNGTTWTIFPDVTDDGAPAVGGYLPNVDVTNLQLDLGVINPATGHPTQVAGDRELLLATTGGRGNFAIGLAPDIIPGYTKLALITDTVDAEQPRPDQQPHPDHRRDQRGLGLRQHRHDHPVR